MTYYHILFGLIFVGALRELFYNVGFELPDEHFDFTTNRLPEAAALTLLVLCDMMFTSNMIEERNKEYKWKLQLIDTANFFVLAGAILVIIQKPNEFIERLNLFGWKPPIDGFWACIGSYFFFLAWWNKINATCQGQETKHSIIQIGMGISALAGFGLHRAGYLNGGAAKTF